MNIEILNGKRLHFQSDNSNQSSMQKAGQWLKFNRIEIANGIIQNIDANSPGFKADVSINAQGCLVFPGLIDLSVHLREPGFKAKGSIETETRAAAAGGVTTLCCSPETDPVNDSEAVSNLIEELALKSNHCKVLPLGALTQGLKGDRLSEYAAMKDANCIALSNGYNPVKNLAITKRCFEYAKTHELSVFLNPIESSLHQGVMHEGHISTTIGLQGISSLAETIAVSQLIQLASATGVHLHLSQLSAKESVKQLQIAKNSGINVTADVAIHNLIYTDTRVTNFNSHYHCLPPLRSESDRLALIEGLKNGVIDAITSAHQPHEAAAKQMPFAETQPGMSSIEFLLPMAMVLSNGEGSRQLPLVDFISLMSQGPANVLELPSPQVEIEQAANICIFDPQAERKLHASDLMSRGKNTPLLAQTLTGQVKATIFEGNISHLVE